MGLLERLEFGLRGANNFGFDQAGHLADKGVFFRVIDDTCQALFVHERCSVVLVDVRVAESSRDGGHVTLAAAVCIATVGGRILLVEAQGDIFVALKSVHTTLIGLHGLLKEERSDLVGLSGRLLPSQSFFALLFPRSRASA